MAGIIRTKIRRPDSVLIEAFKEIPASVVSDCMNRMNCMHAEIKPMVNNVKLVGPAITVQCISGGNIMSHQAICLAEPGDVVVIDARGDKNTAVWGYVQTFACLQKGVAGVVIDGSIRDTREIREQGFPLFCTGSTPAGPHKGWPDNINVPISCGGAPVHPGDIIVGDDDGVVVVPARRAELILEEAKKRLEVEEVWFAGMRQGQSSLEIIGLDKIISKMDVEYDPEDDA